MKSVKKWSSIMVVCVLVINLLCLPVFAQGEIYFGFSDNTVPANWKLNSVAEVRDKMLEVNVPSNSFAVYSAKAPYLNGETVLEFDLMSKSDAMNVYVQNPNGGSVFRLQQVKGTTTFKLQHSKDDATANQNTAITSKFQKGQRYHVKALINYSAPGGKARVSVWMYDAQNVLVGSAENKVYMDASKYGSPSDFRIFQVNIPAAVTEGSVYFDNIAVYQNTDESAVDTAILALNPNDGAPVDSSIVLPAVGLGGTSVTWKSGNPSILSDSGTLVSLPESQTVVNLQATVQKGGVLKTAELPVTILGQAGGAVEADVYYFDFEDNLLPAGFASNNPEKAGVSNRRLEFQEDAGGNPQIILNLEKVNNGFGAVRGEQYVELDFMTTTSAAPICYIQAAPNGGSLVRIEQKTPVSGQVVTGGTDRTANVNTPFELKQGQNCHAKIYLNYTNETCSVYIDDTPVAENHFFMKSESPGYLRDILMQNAGKTEGGLLAIDNLAVYQNDTPSSIIATQKALWIDTEKPVVSSLTLPRAGYNGVSIGWESSNPELIDHDGTLLAKPARE